jgi:Mn2+/Fe2+ NRAMP family transporter
MVSAAGSGELLFTPRIGSLYGYGLLWALLAAVLLKWSINREIGRYAVCTGRPIIDGLRDLPGPRGWAIWLILGPQVIVAVATIAGLASVAATALSNVLPGPLGILTTLSIAIAAALVVLGRYGLIERIAIVLALALGIAILIAAVSVQPSASRMAQGLVPSWDAGYELSEVLPWLGFMLSGAAGLLWYSHWLPAKGYGVREAHDGSSVDPRALDDADRGRLRSWIGQMTLDNSVAVAGTLILTVGFLVLGVELLGAQGLTPEGPDTARVLGELLGGVWGPVGFWFMIVAVFIGFWDTVLADQDGFGRLFARGLRILHAWIPGVTDRTDEERLRRSVVIVLTAVLPALLFLAVGEPVTLLQIAGMIEAAHIPIVAAFALLLNRRALPPDLGPSSASLGLALVAIVFFAGFAIFYLAGLVTPMG